MLFGVAVAAMMALAFLWYIFASRKPSPTTDPSPNPSPTADPSASLSPEVQPSPSPSPTPQPSQNQEMTGMHIAYWLQVMISCKCAYACNEQDVLHLLNKTERGFHDFKQYQLSKEMEACGAKVRYCISRMGPKELIISIAVKGTENISDKEKAICLHPTGLFEGCVSSIVWKLTNQIPWKYLLKVFKDEELIISGHYIGGAVAQLVTVLMKCHLRQKRKGLDGKKIRCITFGSPRFAYDSFTAFTEKTEDDVLIENVGLQFDDNWIEEIAPQQCSLIQQVIASSFSSVVKHVEKVAQTYGDTGLPPSKGAINAAKVLSAILQLDKDGVVPSVEGVLQVYGDTDLPASGVKDVVEFISAMAQQDKVPTTRPTPVLLGQKKSLIEATNGEVSESRTAYGKLNIDEYLNSSKNHFHDNLHPFDPTDAQPENLPDPQLHLDAEYHEGILQMKVYGVYDILDLDTFDYKAAQPQNVFLMGTTKTETSLTLKIYFPYDPEEPNGIDNPAQFTCETHFGDMVYLEVPYDTKGLFCSCMKDKGRESVGEVVMKAIKRIDLDTKFSPKPKDECNKNRELADLIGKLKEVTTKDENVHWLKIFTGNTKEKEQTDDVKLLASNIQRKIHEEIEIKRKLFGFELQAVLALVLGAATFVGSVASGIPEADAAVFGSAVIICGALSPNSVTWVEQYRAVLKTILEKLFEEGDTRTSCNCKLEKRIQEVAIREKIIYENMLSVNEKELKKRGAMFSDKTRSQLSKRLHAVCIISRIREILLKDVFIFVVGQQNHGKTTLVQQLTGEEGQPDRSGYNNNTDKPTLCEYTVGKDVITLVDMPATSAIEEDISKLSTEFGKSADLLIWVYLFNGNADKKFEDEKKHILSVGRPVLLCFSKCMLAASDGSMKNGGNIGDLLPKVEDVPNVEDVIPMELTEDGQKSLANKKIRGARSSEDVGKWISLWKERYLKTQMQCKF